VAHAGARVGLHDGPGEVTIIAPVLPNGKLPPALLDELLGELGSPPAAVQVGPGVGEDAAVVDIGGISLVVASDPVTLTGSGIAHLVLTINANDVAVTGARPEWFLATVLLPSGTTEAEVRDLFAELADAVKATGVSLIGGHTEVTGAVTQPVIAGTMLGAARRDRIVDSAGARAGDTVVQVGMAPIEGAAVLASSAHDLGWPVDSATVSAALAALHDPGVSVVEAALAAAELSATAMHDPTEGGIRGALNELAVAAGVAIHVDTEAIDWFAPGVELCRAAGLDPSATLASGALLATFSPSDADDAIAGLTRRGHRATVIGAVEAGTGVTDGHGRPLAMPERDEIARLGDLTRPG